MTREPVNRPDLLIARAAQAMWDNDSITQRVIYLAGLGGIDYSIAAGTSALPGQWLAVLSLTSPAGWVWPSWAPCSRAGH